jgi:exodeoxyribonuclease III
MLCLQETKLQEMHLEDNKKTKVPAAREMLKEDGYSEYWSFSTEKKGYSGTAVFIKEQGGKKAKQQSIGNFFAPKSANSKTEGKKKAASKSSATLALPVSSDTLTPKNISYKIGKEIDNEGRTITVEFPWATLTNVYVPNAGQDLKRLEYRTSSWDKDFFEFQKKKEADRKLPVIWLGDLNIAHKPFDVWNNGASHLVKQAGVTPQERASFQEQLDTGFVDAFRRLHPDAKGNYSYWSQRAGNRVPNKGLRLDYFICSPELFEDDSKVVVRDSYMLKDCLGSDHCPVVLELEIKP